MFVMQTYVVRQDVEWSVVGVCFGGREVIQGMGRFLFGGFRLLLCDRLRSVVDLGEEVMFCDEVACAWMERAGEERAQDEVEEGL